MAVENIELHYHTHHTTITVLESTHLMTAENSLLQSVISVPLRCIIERAERLCTKWDRHNISALGHRVGLKR